jgi:BirA family transcriptional regulator, biotin operon repressor / biotin---[acetyl-CoA-carboxylase] ligase
MRQATFVRTVDYHREVTSTNTRALSLAEDPTVALPALVLAERQTAGRGRGSHRWWSAPGALTFSLLVSRDKALDETAWPRVALTTGLAVCDALQQLRPGLEIGLKWPNDVFVQSRKICGVLVEVPPRMPTRLVIGVGVNVNNAMAAAPDRVPHTAISLIDVTGYPFDLTLVLIRILQQIASQFEALDRVPTALVSRWQELCMLTGRRVRVEAGQRATVGTCQGIDDAGALLLQTAQGVERCVSGVVTMFSSEDEPDRA